MAGPVDPRLVRRGRATRRFLAALVLLGLVQAGAIVAQAWLLAASISHVFAHHSWPTGLDGMGGWLLGLAAVFSVRALVGWGSEGLAHHAVATVKAELRRDLARARLARPMDSSTSSATLATLATQGLDALDGYYARYLPQLVLAVLVPLVVGTTVLRADLASALILAVTLPLIPLFMALIGWTTQRQVARRWSLQTRLANHFADLVAGLATLQVFGRAASQQEGLRRSEERHRAETMRTLRVSFLSSFALELLATLSVALVAVTVGFRVVFEQMDLRTALFVLVLAPEAYLPVRQVGTHYHDATDGMAAADQALAIIEGAGVASPSPSPTALAPARRLEVRDLRVSFPGSSRPVLDGESLHVEAGEVVALSGPSGCGKSTLLHVVMGFLPAGAGEVLLDGRPVDDQPDAWREQVAWVAQEPGMPAATIGQNVALGCPGIPDGELRRALDLVGGGSLALERPVGEDGEGLSAGELRRVAMARALVRVRHGGARWLLVDEPTAGLDARAEAAVVASLLQAARQHGAGALVVSHRPAVLECADRQVRLGGAGAALEVSTAAPAAPAPLPVPVTRVPAASPAGGTWPSVDPLAPASGPRRPGRTALGTVVQMVRALPGGGRRLALASLLAVLATGASVALMGVSAWLLSRAAEHPPVLYLEAAAVGVRFFGILRGVARYAERLVGHDLALRMQSVLRLRSYQALARSSLLGASRGDLLTRVVQDVAAIQDVVVRVALPMLSAGVVVLGTSAALAVLDPASAAVLLTSALLAGLVLPRLAQRGSLGADHAAVQERAVLATTVERLGREATEVVALGLQDRALAQLDEVQHGLARHDRRAAWVRGLATAGQQLAAGVAVLAALWFGSRAVASGELLGRTLAVLVLTPLALHESLAALAQAAQAWTRSRASLERVAALLERPAVGRGDRPVLPPSDDPGLVLRDVAIGWPGQPVLVRGISLELHRGDRVAVVGPSGVGKTTLAATVMGLLPPVAGQVEARGTVGHLAQDAHVFATTVRENVRIGRPGASDEQVREALRRAGLELPLERMLGEHGATLSGGEVRRLALARVLVGGRDVPGAPQVLVLDEPTEHLDAPTARRLLDDLWERCGDMPMLVVTHDPAVVSRCTAVLELAPPGVSDRVTAAGGAASLAATSRRASGPAGQE